MNPDRRQLAPRVFYAQGGQMQIGVTPADVLLSPRKAPEFGTQNTWGVNKFSIPIPDEALNDQNHPFWQRDTSSRSNVDTSTYIDRGRTIRLNVPIVSSPMVDVTEKKLAVALGQVGGLGIIHRGMKPKEQAEQVKYVKGAMGYVFKNPPTLSPSASVATARNLMNEVDRRVVVVTSPENKVVGIITNRDIKKGWVPDDMTLDQVQLNKPRTDVVTVTTDVNVHPDKEIYVRRNPNGESVKATDLMWRERIEKLVVTDADGHLMGVISDFDIRQLKEHPNAAIDSNGHLFVGAAVNIDGRFMERVEHLKGAGVDLVCIDTANCYTPKALNAIKTIKAKYPDLILMAGSIATADIVETLAGLGVDSIRDNIGSGSICITRGVSGFGVPTLKSIMEVSSEADKFRIPVVGDGGVETSSDLTKYLAAGAGAAMLGKLLSATNESSAERYIDGESGRQHVLYYGMAAERNRKILAAAEEKLQLGYIPKQEGVPIILEIKGSVAYVVNDLVAGLRSGMTYGGVITLEQLRNETDFILVLSGGSSESGVRGNKI